MQWSEELAAELHDRGRKDEKESSSLVQKPEDWAAMHREIWNLQVLSFQTQL